jgi:hypothetical protein
MRALKGYPRKEQSPEPLTVAGSPLAVHKTAFLPLREIGNKGNGVKRPEAQYWPRMRRFGLFICTSKIVIILS